MVRNIFLGLAIVAGTIVVGYSMPGEAQAVVTAICPSPLPTPLRSLTNCGYASGGGAASPCPTSQVNGGCNVNVLNGDEAKSINLQVAVSGSLATASTTFLIVAGSTTQNRIVWSSGITGNAVAGVTAIYKIGQTNVSACDTNCVTWTPTITLTTTAGNITCLWGTGAPPGSYGMCGIPSGGLPLPATNPATNLYVTIGTTAPTAGTAATSYWTNPY